MPRALLAGVVRILGEAERHVLVRAKEANHLAALRVRRHAVPQGRLERGHAAHDERGEALSHGAARPASTATSASFWSARGPGRAADFFAAFFAGFLTDFVG